MINKAIILGNVGKDPEIRVFQNGNKVASFSMATTESWKDKTTGEWVNKTEWHNIQVFGKLADIVELKVKKGVQLYIEGKIQTRTYDKADGSKGYIFEIALQGFGGILKILDKKPSDNTRNGVEEAKIINSKVEEPVEDSFDDDIPF